MAIIRRNTDGSIASREGFADPNQTTTSHPALAGRRGMSALAESGRAVPPLLNEIANKVNNAKDKPRKLKVLQDHDSPALRQVLKGAFDPKIEWLLPIDADIPYKKNEAPIGTDHTLLTQEAKRLYLFTKGGDATLTRNKREVMFIQMLEGLCAEEAEFLITAVSKKINNKYKGFTANLVKEAFNWDDDFMKK
jgi:hypothetical protein|tara:strand:+ start:27 stop:605 length:579 start_codon:yes stop_codon:yes gene_type:complete